MNDSQDKPRKILLGKKVIRHFTVRSGIQTGINNSAVGSDSTDGSSGEVNTSTGQSCSANTSTNTNCQNQTVTPSIIVKATGTRC